MKDKSQGFIKLLLSLIIVAALGVVAFVGIGSNNTGSLKDIKLGLDLAGGVSITYEAVKENPTKEEMADTVYKLQKRVDNYSTESAVYQEGGNRINVDIPGVTDANEILSQLGKAGALEFKDEAGKVLLNGADIKTAEAGVYQKQSMGNEYVVQLTLTQEGADKFNKATTANVGKKISIYYDKELISAPNVKEAIAGGKASISGQASFEEAQELASIIRIGALPLELKEIRSNIVGAKLGAEAIHTSLLAGVIGIIMVISFLIIVYRIPGLASSIALLFYVTIVLILLNVLDVTLTLPGVAGIVLSIGMAVDANVIIFTRIKEEIATGKTVKSSIKIGFHKALSAIIDGNVTTLIAAAVLWLMGSGTVKGFAQTLAIGIIVSMFTALTVTRFILNALFAIGLNKEGMYGTAKNIKTISFIRGRIGFFAFSIILILVGIGALVVNKRATGEILAYGLDFRGGTSTTVTFNEALPEGINTELTELVTGVIRDPGVEISQVKDSNAVIIKTKELTLDERTEISDKLVKEYKVDKDLITTESISGTVSDDMKKDAIMAVAVSTLCMLLYIWIRFKDIHFATSAVLALLHDVLVVLMVYAVSRITVNSTFIACMLTIVGYSINATIIIFDRIRENMKEKSSKVTIEEVVNNSITQTLTRCINTSLTTFIMVFVLFLFGVESIKEFAIPLMAGIVCGAYSSICITGILWATTKNRLSKRAVVD
ncbi:protein translocase subunit SecD [Anaerocolumna cellulosilytica]|nr:protein translocase subunit SecD [Anaerocolumna cellulosilytica]